MTPGIARHIPLALAAVAIAVPLAPAQTAPPDYGHDFVTIGSPGNRPVTPEEAPRWRFGDFGAFGAVGYEYRITRTEITNAQYVGFVNAFIRAPGATPTDCFSCLLGTGLTTVGFDPEGKPIIRPWAGAEDSPANPGWEYAARYTNWLHNGKGSELGDFETGVYDASTFGEDPTTGKRTHQVERNPGATFFLPTYDEWAKAVHYDPDRYGEGAEGYWLHPGGSDEVLISGPPGEPGAQTSAGQRPPSAPLWSYPVGLYPETTSPWGLLDASGGEREWTETVLDLEERDRILAGSGVLPDLLWREHDRLDEVELRLLGSHGFRVAGVVPAPSTVVILLPWLVYSARRQRR